MYVYIRSTKICKHYPVRAQSFFSQLRKSNQLVLFVAITKCLLIEKEVILILKLLVIFCNFKKNADISILVYFLKCFYFLVGKLCTKHNVYIVFLT